MNYSRRQLEAMGEPLGESVTQKKPGGRIYGGGGPSGPSSSTVYQNSIPKFLEPYAGTMMGATMSQLFNTSKDAKGNLQIEGFKPYIPYSANPEDYVAGFSPLQQQVQYNAANLQMPGQYNQATGFANAAGQGGLESAQQAYGYGNAGFQSGQLGQQLGLQAAQQAEQRAQQAEQAAYGYGNAGFQSGMLGQQLGIQGGQRFGEMGAGYGQQAANLAGAAQGYGGMGSGYGQRAANIGEMALEAQDYGRMVGNQAQNYAAQSAGIGDLYGQMATSPGVYQAYMSPYQEAVTENQIAAAQRQADIARQARKTMATKMGAYGGGRQAIEEAEANRALQTQMDAIRAQGLQNAYSQAQQNINQRALLGLQGLSGAQTGLGTALQGGQLGLSGIGQAIAGQQAGMQGAGVGLQGLSAANQAYQTGIQGAGMGLQGVNAQLAGTAQGMQGAQVGLQGVDRALAAGQLSLAGTDRGLAGTAQGMQGAQVGLQGVSGAQAGYGLANQAASNLANIGTQQLGAQTGILDLQNKIGAQEQQRQQQIIDNAINNYAQAQQYPQQQLSFMNSMLRGLPTQSTSVSSYQAAPAIGSQIAGFGTALYGASQKRKGGQIKDGIDKLALYKTMKKLEGV
jgi:hypothetical protein